MVPVDQPWRGNGMGTPGWNDMDPSGPDNDGYCDVEDVHYDKDGTTPCPGPLLANNDSYSMSHSMIGSWLYVDVKANDAYNLMPPPTVNILVPPQHGTLSPSMYYDPDDNYATCYDAGTYTYCYDVFYYNLTQSGVTSNTAAAVIKVTNQKPVATDDAGSTLKNMQKTLNVVIPNDRDGDPYDTMYIDAVTDPPPRPRHDCEQLGG